MNEKEMREELGQLNSEIQSVRKSIDKAIEIRNKKERQKVSEEKLMKQVEETRNILKSLKAKLNTVTIKEK